VRCIELAIANPPERGDRVQIYNQTTEVHRVIDLANLVARLTGAEVDLVDNPRKEATENDLVVENKRLLGLGLQPTMLKDDLLREVTQVAGRYLDRVDRSRIPCTSRWTRAGSDAPLPPLSRS
jgi:UDP-sulfoquinovose synthase